MAKSPGEGNSIYEVTQIDFIPFDPNISSYQNVACQETLKYLEGVKKIIEDQGFFFSYYTDLSSNLQRFTQKMQEVNAKCSESPGLRQEAMWFRNDSNYDKRYIWNYNWVKEF